MTQEEFWSTIDAAAALFPDANDRIRTIAEQLGEMPAEEVASFRDHTAALLAGACLQAIYSAGVLLTGRTFDAARFELFRVMLLLRGRALWQAVQANPDALAHFAFSQQEKELDFAGEMFLYAPQFAFQDRYGEDADLDESFPPAPAAEAPEPEEEFTFDKEKLREQFPQLWPRRRAMVEPKTYGDPEGH